MDKKILIPAILVAAVIASGCTSPQDGQVDGEMVSAKKACISLCQKQTINLSEGPCLSDSVAPGWVCDVAHSPREAADSLPENQCEEWGKTANHFVEVDPQCNFIRAI